MTRKELVQKFFIEGYDKQNYDFVLNSLAPDYVDHSPAGARGARAAADILKAVAGMFGELRVEVLDLFAEGDMVAARVRYSGIHTGDWMGIAATGRRVSFEALEHFRVTGGVIAESWGYWPDREIEELLRR